MANKEPRFNETPLEEADRVRWTELSPGVYALTGGAAIVSADGTMIAPLDEITSAQVVISTQHNQVHEGETFISSIVNVALGNNATLEILLRVGAVKFPHLTWATACGGNSRVTLLENVAVTNVGTELSERRMNRPKVEAADVSAFFAPTTGGGVPLIDFVLPGGAGGNASGNQLRTDTEFILKRGTDYLLRLTNLSGQARIASVLAEWYEESKNG